MKFNAEKVVYNESNIFSRPCSIAFMGSWKNKKGKQMILFFIETAVCSKEVSIPLDKLNTPARVELYPAQYVQHQCHCKRKRLESFFCMGLGSFL